MKSIILHVLLLQQLLLGYQHLATSYKFALVPKTMENPFFIQSLEGCEDRVALWDDNSTCLYGGVAASPENPNPDPDGRLQADYVRQLLHETDDLDGLAISVKNPELLKPIIDGAAIPVIAFDSDAPNSKRRAYVGTDSVFLGQTLAKVAQQICPEGGTFGLLAPDSSPNVLEREIGFRSRRPWVDLCFTRNTVISGRSTGTVISP